MHKPEWAGHEAMRGVLSEASLGGLNAKVIVDIIASCTDIALLLSADGTIDDISLHPSHRDDPRFSGWVGQPWSSLVTRDSQPKIQAILAEVGSEHEAREREIHHRHDTRGDLPVRYSAVSLGKTGRILAFGRELGSLAELQQRLIQAQQTMEREYAQLRNAETRYRLFFQISAEAVLIADANTKRISEVNPAALELVRARREKIEGKSLTDIFHDDNRSEISVLLETLLTSRNGKAPRLDVKLHSGQTIGVLATVFRQSSATHFLLRLVPEEQSSHQDRDNHQHELAQVVQHMPEAFVVVDDHRRVVSANSSFFDLVQIATESQLYEQPLDRWLGRPGVDLNILMANLHEHGSVRNFATVVRRELGSEEQVEVSAVSVMNQDRPCCGFMLRTVQTPMVIDPGATSLPQSVQELTSLVGRVSLKDIVRETTESIERLCIEAALEVSGGNRASAAQILGLSRQSLYAKLRRDHVDADDGDDN